MFKKINDKMKNSSRLEMFFKKRSNGNSTKMKSTVTEINNSKD